MSLSHIVGAIILIAFILVVCAAAASGRPRRHKQTPPTPLHKDLMKPGTHYYPGGVHPDDTFYL